MSLEVIKDFKEKLQNLEDLKKEHKSLGHYLKSAIRSDREAKLKEWKKSFNKDSPSHNRALKTKPFDKKRLTRKPQPDVEKIQALSREKTRQYALQEKTNRSLAKNGQRDSDEKEKEKEKGKIKRKVGKNSAANRDAFEESRKLVKELELKKVASPPIHDPPSDDEETLQDDKTKYRIKKKTKLEEDGSGSKSNSIGFSQIGGLLGNSSSRLLVQDRIENVTFKPLTTVSEGQKSSGAHDGFFLGKLCYE